METIQKGVGEGITSELALVQAAKGGDLEAFSDWCADMIAISSASRSILRTMRRRPGR